MEIKKITKKNYSKICKKIIFCPTCKKKSIEPFAPFCSNKCSDLDLIKWLTN